MNAIRTLSTLLLFLLYVTLSSAQTQSAEALLRSAEERFNRSGGVKASFTMRTENNKSGQTDSFEGAIRMAGSHFHIKTVDLESWFDGKSLWTHLIGSDEVNLTTPSTTEMDAMNPAVLFRLYKNGFNTKLIGTRQQKGATITLVELTPKAAKSDLQRIVIGINPLQQIVEIEMSTSDRIKNKITIHNYESGVTLPHSTFRFDPTQNPTLELIDLR